MARSTYIYVVARAHVAIGTFTVKHELATAVANWLDKYEGEHRVHEARRLRIHRYPDGKMSEPVNGTEQFHWDERFP